jgi:protein-tyrosine phosphatase
MDKNYIDFHAHILPHADHGSSSAEMSLAQLNLAKRAGIGTIIATPHFYPDRHDIHDFLKRRDQAYTALDAINDTGIKIVLGAEVLLCEGLAHLDQLEKLTVAGTRVLLVEMPDHPWPDRVVEALGHIASERGLTQVLAHVDRYPKQDIEILFAQGLIGQVNAGAVCALLTRQRVLRWVEQGHIVALGSDIHQLSNAYQYYKRAMRVLGKQGQHMQDTMAQLVNMPV